MIKILPVTAPGQIQVGDVLLIDDGRRVYSAPCAEICRPHIDPEIVINRKRNQYFITSMYLAGQSWVKEVQIVRHQRGPANAKAQLR